MLGFGVLLLEDPVSLHGVLGRLGNPVEIRGEGFQKFLDVSVLIRLVEDPEAVPAEGREPRVGKDAEMPRDARLPHFENGHQFVHGKLVVQENAQKPQPRLIGEGLENGNCGHVCSRDYAGTCDPETISGKTHMSTRPGDRKKRFSKTFSGFAGRFWPF